MTSSVDLEAYFEPIGYKGSARGNSGGSFECVLQLRDVELLHLQESVCDPRQLLGRSLLHHLVHVGPGSRERRREDT